MNTPQQQAEELARKCAIELLSVHYTRKFLESPGGTPIINKAIRNLTLPLTELIEVARAARCYCEYSNKDEHGDILWGGNRLIKQCEVCIAKDNLRKKGFEL